MVVKNIMSSYCTFCKSNNHTSITCDVENRMAPYFKKEVGIKMEEYITKHINCQKCNKKALIALKDYTPSLDIVCMNCNAIYEVKSKCLSVKELPNYIFCNGGNYNKFKENISNGLNLFVIVYGVNRLKKEIIIRNVYYASNEILQNKQLIDIEQKNNTTLSTIKIFNKNKLQSLNFIEKVLSFKVLYNSLIQNITI